MSFCDSFPPFAPFPNGINSMAVWPQFPYKQSGENSIFDHESPPMKRPKISSNSQFPNQNHGTHQMNPPVNQPNGKIFFKTRLCIKFEKGQCKNGENCNFAHGEEDLRKPPPNWQELIGSRMEDKMNNWEDDDKMISRKKLCWKFYNGEECPYGARCNFSHERPPKFWDNSTRFRDDHRECFSTSIGTIRSSDQYANANGDAMRGNSRPAVHWKTKLCTKFQVTGHCPFGDNCYYAHGQEEVLLPGDRPSETDESKTHYVPLKCGSTMDIVPIPSKAYVAVASTQSVQPKNGFTKWKLNKKMNGIYGDWIDDQPLILPNEEEN
ncbi:unnamed protein product [Amaranthus hypochondriacus]